MSDIIIVVKPAFDRTSKRKHERFDAYLHDTGQLICSATRQPLLDASRVLLARGYDPKDVICKVRSEAPQIVTMRAIIGIAAQYDVMGEKFVRRKAAGPDAPHKNRTQVAHSFEARQAGTKSKTKPPEKKPARKRRQALTEQAQPEEIEAAR